MTDIPTDEMIEAGVAAFNQTETLSVRRLLRVAYPAMRATDPALKECVETLANAKYALEYWDREARVCAIKGRPWVNGPFERGREELNRIDATLAAMTKGEE